MNVSLARSTFWLPLVHLLLFAATCLIAFAQTEPLLDGPAHWPFLLLLVADFPISMVAFSAIWDGKMTYALWLWGVLGTAWWFLLSLWLRSALRRRTRA